ncbi:MAG: hypothetical protein AAF587_43960, partial [Bacteroidota bacterium]
QEMLLSNSSFPYTLSLLVWVKLFGSLNFLSAFAKSCVKTAKILSPTHKSTPVYRSVGLVRCRILGASSPKLVIVYGKEI